MANAAIHRLLSPLDGKRLSEAFKQGGLAEALGVDYNNVYKPPVVTINESGLTLPHLSRTWGALNDSAQALVVAANELKANSTVNALLVGYSAAQSRPEKNDILVGLTQTLQSEDLVNSSKNYIECFEYLEAQYKGFGKLACDTINQLPFGVDVKQAHLRDLNKNLEMIDSVVALNELPLKNSSGALLGDHFKDVSKKVKLGIAPSTPVEKVQIHQEPTI